MVRSGTYALYNGKEFKLITTSDGELELISNDKKDIFYGFIHYYEDCFVKKVTKSELGPVYSIKTFALYKGVKLSVGTVKNDKVLLGTSDSKIAEQLDFDRTDKYFYEKWLDVTEVQFIEEKTPTVI